MDFKDIYLALFGMNDAIAPEYLLICLIVAYVVWRRRKPGVGFWAWLTPRAIWTHRSHRLDLMLFALDRLLHLSGLVARVVVTPVVAVAVAQAVGREGAASVSPWILAVLLFLVSDASTYGIHRFLHTSRRFWPIHAVHHSAEVMTPITTYRQHPLWTLTATFIQTMLTGAVMGLVVGAVSPDADIAQIVGINAFIVLANAGLAALHHSHIWISFGPVLEHIVISPAQHQIHHSTKPEHHGKNYGNSLAVWDWMFGSLYVTRGQEEIGFGLDGLDGEIYAEQKLRVALTDPLRRVFSRS